MPRDISGVSLNALLAQSTPEALIVLLTITDESDPENIVVSHYTSDSVDRFVDPDTYFQLPFDIVLPNNVDGQTQMASIQMENVSRDLIDEIRQNTVPLKMDIQVVLGSDPTDVIASFPEYRLRQVSYNAQSLSGQLSQESFMNEMVGVLMTGLNFPGLFYV